ncbi:MAG: hypothetical protein EA403_11495 [Spirochaetaceae bacterium]|nr:MAG: hypothetical protein EA403_11495 [Spirochaetaceae bacterium]
MNQRVRRFAAVLLGVAVWFAVPGFVFAYEISDGAITVRLDENSGRLALFAVRGVQTPLSLLFEPDPRTSTISVLEGNRIHRMGDSGGFARTMERAANRLTVEWRSSSLRVRQHAVLDRNAPGQVRMRIEVTNLSETARPIGIRYLIDSAFAGVDGAFFRTEAGQSVTTEYRMLPSPTNRYWVSFGREGAFFALVHGDRVTEPEAVVFGNWKRLNDARWDYAVSGRRGFSLVPFSMNDSAALLLYPSLVLNPGASRSVDLVLGVGDAPGARIAQFDGAVPPIAAAPAPSAPAARATPVAQATTDSVAEVNEVLREINRLLSSPRAVETADVEALQQRLEAIQRERAAADGNRR